MKIRATKNVKKFVICLILSFLALTVSSCATQNSMKIESIPAPPGARRGVTDSSLKTPATTAANLRLIDIAERFDNYESEIYELTEATDWQKIGGFYDAELGKYGFARQTGVPSAPIDADIIYYGRTSNAEQKIAVALFEVFGGAGAPTRQFLLIATTKP